MVYYSKKTVDNDRYMNDFHNSIKMRLLRYVETLFSHNPMRIHDIGSGRGGDLHKILNLKNVGEYLGVDLHIDEAQKRLKEATERGKGKGGGKGKGEGKTSHIRYVKGDFNKPVIVSPQNKYEALTFFFSLHYFFSPSTRKTLAHNINSLLEVNGVIVATVFNGKLLRERMPINIYIKGELMFSVIQVSEFKISVLNRLISDIPVEEYIVDEDILSNFLADDCSVYPVIATPFTDDLNEKKSLQSRKYYSLVQSGDPSAIAFKQFSDLSSYYVFRKYDIRYFDYFYIKTSSTEKYIDSLAKMSDGDFNAWSSVCAPMRHKYKYIIYNNPTLYKIINKYNISDIRKQRILFDLTQTTFLHYLYASVNKF